MTLFIIIVLAIAVICLLGGQIWASYLLAKDKSCTRIQLYQSTICTIQAFGFVLLVGGVGSLIIFS